MTTSRDDDRLDAVRELLAHGSAADRDVMVDVLQLLVQGDDDDDDDRDVGVGREASATTVDDIAKKKRSQQQPQKKKSAMIAEPPVPPTPIIIRELTDEEHQELKRRVRAKEAARRYRKRQKDAAQHQRRELAVLTHERDILQREYETEAHAQAAVDDEDEAAPRTATTATGEVSPRSSILRALDGLSEELQRAAHEEQRLIECMNGRHPEHHLSSSRSS